MKKFIGKKISDKIESSSYGKTKAGRIAATVIDSERFEERGLSAISEFEGDMRHAHFRNRAILISVVVNAISWGALLLSPATVSRLAYWLSIVFSKGGLVLLVPAFGTALYGVHAVLRIWFPDAGENQSFKTDVMQSYQNQADSTKVYRIWIVSSAIAGLNTALLFLAYFYITGEWKFYTQ